MHVLKKLDIIAWFLLNYGISGLKVFVKIKNSYIIVLEFLQQCSTKLINSEINTMVYIPQCYLQFAAHLQMLDR